MSSRRHVLLGLSSALPLAAAAALLPASGAAQQPDATPSLEDLRAQMAAFLATLLDDAGVAEATAAHVAAIGLDWTLPTVPAGDIDRIIAFAFGNRPNTESGNTPTDGTNQTALPDPGPINELLADSVHAIRQLRDVKVYAQWEIARFLESKYGMDNVHAIEPVIAADGTITYLSTDGVLAAIMELEGGADAMGKVGIVGHRDHAKRCIQLSRLFGLDAAAVAEVPLPAVYDALSGQPWTRQRELYLVHDMYAQMAVLRQTLIATAYPEG